MCRQCNISNLSSTHAVHRKGYITKSNLTMTHPHLVDEWDFDGNGDLMPEQLTAGSNKVVSWKCGQCGQTWLALVAKRTRENGTGCPFCAKKRPIPGKTDLASLYPDLATEWDQERNGELTATDVLPHSNKKVDWKCQKCGQNWKATIFSRTRGNGCPYCAGKLPIPGKTDLATLWPSLVAEWDYEKNDGLEPTQVTPGSCKQVHWICQRCGGRWEAKVYSRTSAEVTGCPYCAGKRPIPGKTDLASQRPGLLEEWDYEHNNGQTPELFVVGSEKPAYWKCLKCGRTWRATIASRTRSNGAGCPYCAGKMPILGETDLASQRPDLRLEWDYDNNNGRKPENFTINSGVKVSWKCSRCNRSWETAIVNRTRVDGSGCPYCSGRLPIPGETDLASQRPDLVEEWDYDLNGALVPEKCAVGSAKNVWWKCPECGGKQRQRILSRVNGEKCICATCRNRAKKL